MTTSRPRRATDSRLRFASTSRPRHTLERLESRALLAATELIRNGGFEGAVAPADWTLTGHFQADSRFTAPRTGSGYAYLANLDGTSGNAISGTMTQQVTIPSNANSLTLNFWTRISTSETTTTAANDTLSVVVLDSTGTTTLQTLTTLSNLNASAGYVQRTFSLNRALIGQSVRFVFSAATNATLPTTFRVDDVSLNAVSAATNNRVVGYLPSYRYSAAYPKLDWSALTHVNYFSVTADTAGNLSTGSITASALNNVVASAHAAGATVGITVGPQSFSTLAGNATARQTFANNIVNFALTYNLDAIDIDWEPPAGNNVPSYTSLVNDLYTVANPQKILITAAVNPWTNEISAATVNSKMAWLNVMCYDFSYANHSTYTDGLSGLTDWTNHGVQKNKIVMGLPFYGRQGTSWSNTTSSTYAAMVSAHVAANGGSYPGPEVDFIDGFYGNGVETIRKKMQYMIDNGYGGAMIWELGQDRWNASNQYDHRSLLPVIKSVVRQAGAIGAVSASPSDNGNAPAGQTQHVTVTVTFNAPSGGVLQVSLLDELATPARSWVVIDAPGTVTKTLTIPVTRATTGQRFYEIYTQFRAGAASGPLTTIASADLLKLTPYRLNWVQFPGAPSNPTPADGATLSEAPALLDWADSPNATSYDVIVNGVVRGTVTSSQWTPTLNLPAETVHTWQVLARSSSGTTTGPTWSFSWVAPDTTPPQVTNSAFDIDTRIVTITFDESLAPTAGDLFAALQPAGTETNLGSALVNGNTVSIHVPTTLADGDYLLRLPSSSVRDANNNPLAADWTMPFYLLAGDVNRDRAVNFDDLLVIAQNYGLSGKTFSQGNLNYDPAGNVDFEDLLIVAQQYGTSLAVATRQASAASNGRESSGEIVDSAAQPRRAAARA